MKYRLTVFLVWVLSLSGLSQDTIVTFDRPGIADSPYLVPRGSFQFEAGTSYAKQLGVEESYLPAFMLRLPVFNKNEIRITLNYEPQSLKYIRDNFQQDLDPVAIGFKRKITKERKGVPEIAFSANVFHGMQRLDSLSKNELNTDFYLLFHDNIGKRHGLNYNLGYVYANSRLKNVLAWSFCYNFSVSEDFTLFGEYFGYYHFSDNRAETGLDAGIVYQLGNTWQVDLSYIYNHYNNSDYHFLCLGLSGNIRFKG